MKQLIQSYKTGIMELCVVPSPACLNHGIVVQTRASIVSTGTEKMLVDFAQKNIFEKIRSRPDLVKQVIDKMKREGIFTTLKKVESKLETPIPLGYSCSGIIKEKGQTVIGCEIGDRVACAGAGYANHAEYNFIPANLFVKIPDAVSDKDAAFTTIGAIALQGVRQAAPSIGDNIAIIGLGLIGLLTIQILKANGCFVIGMDPDLSRVKIAKDIGADEAYTPADFENAAQAFSDGRGIDKTIICAATQSDEPINLAGKICRKKGTVVMVGMTGMNIDRSTYYAKELDFKLSYSYGPGRGDPMYEEAAIDYPYSYVRWTEQRNMEAVLRMLSEGKITPAKLITHEFIFSEVLKAYDVLTKGNCLGIVINYAPETENIKTLHYSSIPKTDGQGIACGFIGAGNFTRAVLLPAVKNNGDFNCVCLASATGTSAQNVRQDYGFNILTSDYKELLSNQDIKAVFITTRHNLHATQVVESLRAGKHVYVEKPLCITPIQLDEILKVWEEHKQQALMVGFNRRHAPFIKQMRDFFNDNTQSVAIHYRVNAGRIPPEHWTQKLDIGGGRIIGEVCHFIDTVKFLARDSKIKDLNRSFIPAPGSEMHPVDNVKLLLSFENGSAATIDYITEMDRSFNKEYIEVSSCGKTAILDDFVELSLYKNGRRSHTKTRQDKGFSNEIAHFEHVVSGKEQCTLEIIEDVMRATFKAAS